MHVFFGASMPMAKQVQCRGDRGQRPAFGLCYRRGGAEFVWNFDELPNFCMAYTPGAYQTKEPTVTILGTLVRDMDEDVFEFQYCCDPIGRSGVEVFITKKLKVPHTPICPFPIQKCDSLTH